MFLKRKRHYLLVEVILALALFVLVAIPLTQNRPRMLKQTWEYLKEIEKARIADLTYAEILIGKHQLPEWDRLQKNRDDHGIRYILEPVEVTIDGIGSFTVERSAVFWQQRKVKQGRDDRLYQLINCQISFGKKSKYKYQLLVNKSHSTEEKRRL